MQKKVTDYGIYRWRYAIGYTLVVLTVVSAILFAGLFTPGELRSEEQIGAVNSSNLSIKNLAPSMVVNLPYHMLQKSVFSIFGVSTFTIKLPSIILALITVVGVFLLFRIWFKRNVAVIATVTIATTTQFLFLSQDGTPAILFSALTVWLLFSATQATRDCKHFNTFWKVLACVLLAVILYVPLGVYVVIALLIASLFHPHTRYIIKHIPKLRLLLAAILGAATLLPLIYASIVDPAVAKQLLGIPTTPINFLDNLAAVGTIILGAPHESLGYLVRPLYSFGVVALMGIGLFSLFTHRYTARSYTLFLIGIPLVLLPLINPSVLIFVFPFAAILSAIGLAWLINYWYSLFPRNPYARITGLVPLVIIVTGIMMLGVMRYNDNYQYNPTILAYYSSDLSLLNNTLAQKAPERITLIVDNSEKEFYQTVAKYNKQLTVETSVENGTRDTFIATHSYKNHHTLPTPSVVITSDRIQDANRFYIYNSTTK